MRGFEVTYNGETHRAAVEKESCSTVLITQRDDLFSLSFGMIDKDLVVSNWFENELKLGDKIYIEVKDITESSTPIDTYNFKERSCCSNDQLTEEQINDMCGKYLEDFRCLEKKLKEEGLI